MTHPVSSPTSSIGPISPSNLTESKLSKIFSRIFNTSSLSAAIPSLNGRAAHLTHGAALLITPLALLITPLAIAVLLGVINPFVAIPAALILLICLIAFTISQIEESIKNLDPKPPSVITPQLSNDEIRFEKFKKNGPDRENKLFSGFTLKEHMDHYNKERAGYTERATDDHRMLQVFKDDMEKRTDFRLRLMNSSTKLDETIKCLPGKSDAVDSELSEERRAKIKDILGQFERLAGGRNETCDMLQHLIVQAGPQMIIKNLIQLELFSMFPSRSDIPSPDLNYDIDIEKIDDKHYAVTYHIRVGELKHLEEWFADVKFDIRIEEDTESPIWRFEMSTWSPCSQEAERCLSSRLKP